jgi:nucleoside-diphosphate-sugar epimerase
VAVTGAGGFIGRIVTRELLERGWRVTALDLPGALHGMPSSVRWMPCDIRDPATLVDGLRGVDVVFHAAALFDLIAKWPDLYTVNVEGTRNVLDVARDVGVERAVVWGSSSVYGTTRSPLPFIEQREIDERRLNHYARSKYFGELVALEAAQRDGPEVVVVRPADVYGGGSVKGLAQALFAFKSGVMSAVPGPGTAVHSHVHVEDVARAAIHLSEGGRNGEVYNVADRTPISVADLYAMAREKIGAFSLRELRFSLPDRPRIFGRPLFHVPAPVLRAFAHWEVARTRRRWLVKKFGPHPLSEPAGIELLLGHHVVDAAKLLETGFSFVWPDVRVGIIAAVDAYERTDWAAFRPVRREATLGAPAMVHQDLSW